MEETDVLECASMQAPADTQVVHDREVLHTSLIAATMFVIWAISIPDANANRAA